MPARDGTGPLGQGSRTGRGMGNCNPSGMVTKQPSNTGLNQPLPRSRGFWKVTLGRFLGRRGANRINRR